MNRPSLLFERKAYIAWKKSLISSLRQRDGKVCQLCNKPIDFKVKNPNARDYPTIDHIVPLSKGGLDELENMQLAHRKCNEKKADKYEI